jgi:hypothetical protein
VPCSFLKNAAGINIFFIYFYKPHSPSNDVIFIITVSQLVFSTLPLNQYCILLFFPIVLITNSLQNQKLIPKILHHNDLLIVYPFFLSVLLMIITIVSSLTVLQAHATGKGQYVVTRHIIFLTPVGIIGITYLAGLLWQSLKSYFWIRFSILIMIAGLLLFNIDSVWGKIYYLYTNNLFS